MAPRSHSTDRVLAPPWSSLAPAQRPELELAARTAFTILRGTSLTSIPILWGVPLLLREELFPGVLLYGLLASIVVPLWSLALGVAMWRRLDPNEEEPRWERSAPRTAPRSRSTSGATASR